MSLLLTCTVISVDDGLLRTSTGCAGPSSSSTLYADWLKLIVMTINQFDKHVLVRSLTKLTSVISNSSNSSSNNSVRYTTQ